MRVAPRMNQYRRVGGDPGRGLFVRPPRPLRTAVVLGMLKWTVSRSLSTASSTPHGPGGGGKSSQARRPFRDLSNTPPATGPGNGSSRLAADEDSRGRAAKSSQVKSRRRRGRSHGGPSQTKPASPESFYQSTPRVDADIGPLSLFAGEPGRAAAWRSHVSDFFQQISMATSPEDVMESESLPLRVAREESQRDDSSVSSASQLLEEPSPSAWAFCSPGSESESRLRRQRGIRRKRPAQAREEPGKRARREPLPFLEAVNRHVRRLALETDLDGPSPAPLPSLRREQESDEASTPLVATVRRCLEYSPETPGDYPGCRAGSIEIACCGRAEGVHVKIIRCRDLRRACEGPVHAYVKASVRDPLSGEGCVKRTAVHRATPNPVFQESLLLPLPTAGCAEDRGAKRLSLDIAVWHRDRRARRSELLGCMTLPLPLSQDKEATWHPLEAGSGRSSSSAAPTSNAYGRGSLVVSPPLSKDGESLDNNNGDDLAYLRHLELEPLDPLTGLPLHPGFAAKGGRTPCTVTRRLLRPAANQVPWGFSLSWGRPPRVERVDPASPAERSGLRPGDYVVFVEAANVVTRPRDDVLELIQAATAELVLEVYRRGVHGHAATGSTSGRRRSSAVNAVTLQAPVIAPSHHHHRAIAFTAEVGTGVLV